MRNATLGGIESLDQDSRITDHASRITHHGSRITFRIPPVTFQVVPRGRLWHHPALIVQKKVFLGSLALVLSLLALPQRSSAAYTNGIFAEFYTSMGSYTCVLHYAQAPKAVANFIGLATGQRTWLDLPSGLVKTNPFYNG